MKHVMLTLLFFLSCKYIPAKEVVLITGASRGIGLATAELLSQEGYVVYAGVRNPMLVQNVLKKCHLVKLDVTDQQTIDSAISEIFAKEGCIDVLVNNAGIMVYGSIENVTIEEAKKIFEVNFFGAMRMSQAVLPIMRSQNYGKLIQISSRSGFRPLPSISVYAASKYALEGISETMAALLRSWNIYVSLVEPGPVNTDLDSASPYGSRLLRESDPYFRIFENSGLLDPFSPIAQEPAEIARIVQEIIETDQPHFRYQTTENIRRQAALRFVDITGDSFVAEWDFLRQSYSPTPN